jgi:hypothetical protein
MKNCWLVWMIVPSVLGLTLGRTEIAQAGAEPCLRSTCVAAIDFSDDVPVIFFGKSSTDSALFKLSLTRKLPAAISQYNRAFAIAHAPRMVNGLIAVRYDPFAVQQVASSRFSIQCPTTSGEAHWIGCKPISKVSVSRLALK